MSAEGAQVMSAEGAQVMSAEGAQVVSAEGAQVGVEVRAPAEDIAREVERLPVVRAEHPGGEVFFSGEEGNLSDSEAEEVARQQLARSGLLRGQRVRVGD